MRKNRYALIGVILVAAIFAFEYYFLTPRSGLMREELEGKYFALTRDELSVKGAGGTEEEMKAVVEDMKKIEKRLIHEKSAFIASARLQGELSEMTEKSGLRVMTIRPLAEVKTGNYSSIPVYFEGNGTIKQVSDFLRHVESGRFLIKIDKLNINITNLQNPRDLKFKMQVSGLSDI
ncbi:MAG: type 4a pilus biogenesis protein PilO [Nitrospirae bacterium]|nr:type 4a pilus biogenesis protein PilO [Nitrospirota bacterium]